MAVHCGHAYFLKLPIASKGKLVVPAFVAADGRVRFFIINTERTEFLIARPEMAKHVLLIAQVANTGFLKYDSWLSCHEVIGGWTVAEIDATLDCYRGPLDNATLEAVRAIIPGSRLHSEADKVAILQQWPQAPANGT